MPPQLEPIQRSDQLPVLDPDFTHRLESALPSADLDRRRRSRLRRARALLPVLLVLIPIVGWRLMLTTPDGVHVSIAALAWLTFILDVGMHVDSALLSYLGLQALPAIVGILLFVLITGWLLTAPPEEE